MDEEEKDVSEEQEAKEKQTFTPVSKKVNPLAVLSYIGILFLIPWLAAKDDEFAMFHAKQGLTLFIAEAITWAIGLIPVIGWVIATIGWIAWVVLSILGIVNVLQGKKKELPFIGQYAKNWKI